jgi:hypothetical protein
VVHNGTARYYSNVVAVAAGEKEPSCLQLLNFRIEADDLVRQPYKRARRSGEDAGDAFQAGDDEGDPSDLPALGPPPAPPPLDDPAPPPLDDPPPAPPPLNDPPLLHPAAKAAAGRRGERRMKHDKSHQWGAFFITYRPVSFSGAGNLINPSWQARCSFGPHNDDSGRCTKTMSFTDMDEDSEEVTKHRVHHWCNQTLCFPTKKTHQMYHAPERDLADETCIEAAKLDVLPDAFIEVGGGSSSSSSGGAVVDSAASSSAGASAASSAGASASGPAVVIPLPDTAPAAATKSSSSSSSDSSSESDSDSDS